MRLGKTLVRFFAFIRYLLSTKKVPKKDTKKIGFYSKKAVFLDFFCIKKVPKTYFSRVKKSRSVDVKT